MRTTNKSLVIDSNVDVDIPCALYIHVLGRGSDETNVQLHSTSATSLPSRLVIETHMDNHYITPHQEPLELIIERP